MKKVIGALALVILLVYIDKASGGAISMIVDTVSSAIRENK